MLKLADELEALVQAAEKPVPIEVAEAERHLALNGIGPNDPVILCAYGATNRFVPERKGGGDTPYDWDAVTADAALSGHDYSALEGHLTNPDGKTPNLGYISCPGGTSIKKRSEIKQGRVLFVEIDQQGLNKDYQAAIWKQTKLPPPTYQLDTGGKSIWHGWVLDRMVSADQIRAGRARLSMAIEDATGIKTDHALHSPHQPARLAGGIHPKTGQRSVLINVTGIQYGYEEIMLPCPELEAKKGVGSSDNLFPDDREEAVRKGEYPEPPELDRAVPLDLALSHKTRLLIEKGQKAGETIGRPVTAWRLSLTLRAADEQLRSLGYEVHGVPQELFDLFCTKSQLLGLDDLETCRQRHFEASADCGQGELSKSALRRVIGKWAEETGQWRWKPAWGSGRGFATPKASSAAVGRTEPRDRKDLPLHKRLDLFERFLRQSLKRHRNPFRRMVFLRAVVKQLDLGQVVKEKDLPERVVAAMSQRMGGRYQALTAEQRKAMQLSEVVWLVPGVIPAGDLTFVGGRPKVGKTLLVVDLIRCLLNGEGWLGFPSTGVKHTIILVTDDQGDRDTKAMLQRQGLWDNGSLLWSSSFRLDEQQLDQLLDDIKANPGAVVVVDSLRSISRGLAANENDPAMGVLLYDLKTAVMAAGGTLLMIHHASKTSNEVGVEALSGHSSIPGAGNSVVTLHYLPSKDGRSVQKVIPERRLFREGRSGGQATDLVVKIGSAGEFTRIQAFEEYLGKQEEVTRSKRLSGQSQLIQDALCKLLERHDQRLPAIGTLELLKLAGACDESVRCKADLDNDTKHKQLERKLKSFEKQGVIKCEWLKGGFSGVATQQVWSLTDSGAMEVRAALA
jgi:hypothetical protein